MIKHEFQRKLSEMAFQARLMSTCFEEDGRKHVHLGLQHTHTQDVDPLKL